MKISDSHNDIFCVYKTEEEIGKYYNDEVKPYTDKICGVVYTTKFYYFDALKKVAEGFSYFRNVSVNILPCVEDCFFLTPENMDEFLSLKPVYAGLTWNDNNALAGGAFGSGGLTKFGREAVKILEAHGIIVDTAHLNRKSFFEFAGITSKPLFNSHCCIDSLFGHLRNLTDEQIKLITNSKGYMGLAFIPQFISNSAVSSKDLINQIDYFVNKFGCDSIGIGSDFNGNGDDPFPEDVTNYEQMHVLNERLRKIGCKTIEIEKILSKNLLHYLSHNKKEIF